MSSTADHREPGMGAGLAPTVFVSPVTSCFHLLCGEGGSSQPIAAACFNIPYVTYDSLFYYIIIKENIIIREYIIEIKDIYIKEIKAKGGGAWRLRSGSQAPTSPGCARPAARMTLNSTEGGLPGSFGRRLDTCCRTARKRREGAFKRVYGRANDSTRKGGRAHA